MSKYITGMLTIFLLIAAALLFPVSSAASETELTEAEIETSETDSSQEVIRDTEVSESKEADSTEAVEATESTDDDASRGNVIDLGDIIVDKLRDDTEDDQEESVADEITSTESESTEPQNTLPETGEAVSIYLWGIAFIVSFVLVIYCVLLIYRGLNL